MMTEPDAHELLSALLDREPVDPDRLADLLERPEARALLVDFVRLRGALHDDAGGTIIQSPAIASPRPGFGRGLLRIAAALVLIALGALAGRRLGSSDVDAPPEPTRVVRLVSDTTAGGGSR